MSSLAFALLRSAPERFAPVRSAPMGVHQDLAADLKSDLMGEMFVNEEISWMVERESDASAN